MKIKIFDLLYMIMILFVLHACRKKGDNDGCPDHSDEFYNLTSEEKNKIPFSDTGRDTLVYINDAGDKVFLFGNGKHHNYFIDYITGGIPPNCTPSTENYERIEYTFTGDKGITKISYSTGVYDNFPPIMGLIYLTVNNKSFRGFTYHQTFNDTLRWHNKTYNGVIIKGSDSLQDSLSTLFYTYPEGILKIKFYSDTKTWTKL